MQSPDPAIPMSLVTTPTSQPSNTEHTSPTSGRDAFVRDLPIRRSTATPYILGPQTTNFLVAEDPVMIVLPGGGRRTAQTTHPPSGSHPFTRMASAIEQLSPIGPPAAGIGKTSSPEFLCEQDSRYVVKEVETIKERLPHLGLSASSSQLLYSSSLMRESSKLMRVNGSRRSLNELGVGWPPANSSLSLRGLNLEVLRRYIYDQSTMRYKIRYLHEVKVTATAEKEEEKKTDRESTLVPTAAARSRPIESTHMPASTVTALSGGPISTHKQAATSHAGNGDEHLFLHSAIHRIHPPSLRVMAPASVRSDQSSDAFVPPRRGVFERRSASRQPLRNGSYQGGSAKQLFIVRSKSQEPMRVRMKQMSERSTRDYRSPPQVRSPFSASITSTEMLKRLLRPLNEVQREAAAPRRGHPVTNGPFTSPSTTNHMQQPERPLRTVVAMQQQRVFSAPRREFVDSKRIPLLEAGGEWIGTGGLEFPLIPPAPGVGGRGRSRVARRSERQTKAPFALDGLRAYCLYMFIPLLILLAAAAALISVIRYI